IESTRNGMSSLMAVTRSSRSPTAPGTDSMAMTPAPDSRVAAVARMKFEASSSAAGAKAVSPGRIDAATRSARVLASPDCRLRLGDAVELIDALLPLMRIVIELPYQLLWLRGSVSCLQGRDCSTYFSASIVSRKECCRAAGSQ